MATINPAMPSAVQSYMPQQQPLAMKEDKMTDKTSSTTSSGGNTTVSLSSGSPSQSVDYLNLASNKMVKSSESMENKSLEKNETTQAQLTYASNLQMRSNYYQQSEKMEPNS